MLLPFVAYADPRPPRNMQDLTLSGPAEIRPVPQFAEILSEAASHEDPESVGSRIRLAEFLAEESLTADGLLEPGEALTFDIVVTNLSNKTAKDVVVRTRIEPVGVSTILADKPEPAAWSWDEVENLATRTIAALGPDETVILPITFTFSDNYPPGLQKITSLLPDCRSVTGEVCGFDLRTAPNIQRSINLVAEDAGLDGFGVPGETLTYQLTVANEGGTHGVAEPIIAVISPANAVAAAIGSGDARYDQGSGQVTWPAVNIAHKDVRAFELAVTLANELPVAADIISVALLNCSVPEHSSCQKDIPVHSMVATLSGGRSSPALTADRPETAAPSSGSSGVAISAALLPVKVEPLRGAGAATLPLSSGPAGAAGAFNTSEDQKRVEIRP